MHELTCRFGKNENGQVCFQECSPNHEHTFGHYVPCLCGANHPRCAECGIRLTPCLNPPRPLPIDPVTWDYVEKQPAPRHRGLGLIRRMFRSQVQ